MYLLRTQAWSIFPGHGWHRPLFILQLWILLLFSHYNLPARFLVKICVFLDIHVCTKKREFIRTKHFLFFPIFTFCYYRRSEKWRSQFCQNLRLTRNGHSIPELFMYWYVGEANISWIITLVCVIVIIFSTDADELWNSMFLLRKIEIQSRNFLWICWLFASFMYF